MASKKSPNPRFMKKELAPFAHQKKIELAPFAPKKKSELAPLRDRKAKIARCGAHLWGWAGGAQTTGFEAKFA